jgi:hypothetical protein
MALPAQVASFLGVLEYWSIGVLEKPKTGAYLGCVVPLLHYSTTPSLRRFRHEGKMPRAPSGVGSKPGTSLSSCIYDLHFSDVSATMFGDVGLRIADLRNFRF